MTAAALSLPAAVRSRLSHASWRARLLDGLPVEVAREVSRQCSDIAAGPWCERGPGAFSPDARANGHAREAALRFAGVNFELLESEAGIRQRAERFAYLCERAGGLAGMRRIAEGAGLEAPAGRGMTEAGERARLVCPRWWRRRLRHALGVRAENGLRRFGYVRRGRAAYVSDFSLRRRRAQRAQSARAIAGAVLENGEGVQLELFDVVRGSVSNPAIRRAEFMTRARGFEEIAADMGHAAVFVTLTAPSAFHPQLAAGGENPRFDPDACGTVHAGRAWLQKQWARARAKLKRLAVQFYGFRIAEPHHDGTPHWHLLLFGAAAALETVRAVLRGYWLAEYGDEPGARERRVECKAIEPGQGSAAGYVAKYVAKNLDGYRVGDDLEAELPADEGAARVDAWASTHRVRQFQQVGGPPVGLWRELRRLRSPVAVPEIERARLAADAGDWRAFVRDVGGIEAGRKTSVHVWRERTGEQTRYGELRGPVPAGVGAGGARIRTRSGAWRLRWNVKPAPAGAVRLPALSELGPVAITVRAPVASGRMHGRAVRNSRCSRFAGLRGLLGAMRGDGQQRGRERERKQRGRKGGGDGGAARRHCGGGGVASGGSGAGRATDH